MNECCEVQGCAGTASLKINAVVLTETPRRSGPVPVSLIAVSCAGVYHWCEYQIGVDYETATLGGAFLI